MTETQALPLRGSQGEEQDTENETRLNETKGCRRAEQSSVPGGGCLCPGMLGRLHRRGVSCAGP